MLSSVQERMARLTWSAVWSATRSAAGDVRVAMAHLRPRALRAGCHAAAASCRAAALSACLAATADLPGGIGAGRRSTPPGWPPETMARISHRMVERDQEEIMPRYGKKASEKVEKAMHERKHGTLKS